jgi:tetratricopeptide (TPR) repeat protein
MPICPALSRRPQYKEWGSAEAALKETQKTKESYKGRGYQSDPYFCSSRMKGILMKRTSGPFVRAALWIFMLLVLATASLVTIALAQAQTPATPPKIAVPADEEALRKAASIKDPQERLEAFIKVVVDYPNFPYIRNVVYYLMRLSTEWRNDPAKMRAMVDRFVAGTAAAPPYARCEFYSGIARNLMNIEGLLGDAEALSRKGIALLNEKEYIENERRSHNSREEYFTAKDPTRKPEPFSEAEATEKFRSFSSTQHATLGRIFFKQGKMEDAGRLFKHAYSIKPTLEAGLGLADVSEKRGDNETAFEYLSAAALTGRLPASGIARLEESYRKAHGGKIEGLKEYLDARYRRDLYHPLKVTSYTPMPARKKDSNPRVVLAELVTGGGCEPCTAVDLAFDGILERYSRQEVVLIAPHMHAPVSDPLCNHSAESRHKFYDAHGAPTVYLDGEMISTGEGLGTEAKRVFTNIDKAVGSRLEIPAQARIRLDGSMEGGKVKVRAIADEIKSASPDIRLQIALVENEVSYSGENGLRFQAMVLRHLARQPGEETYGFAVNPTQPNQEEYYFDLDQITAANLRYYDEYAADMKKRIGENYQISFREKKNVMNPAELSVVAFLQDTKTKQVLQAASLKLIPGAGKTGR